MKESAKKAADGSEKQRQIAWHGMTSVRRLLALMTALLGLITVIYYIFGPGVGYMHSDCTDTILWAKASYDSGQWVSDNFRYAGILPFGGNLLMLLYMPFFGLSVTTHNLGMLTLAVLLGVSVFLAAKSLKVSTNWSLITVGVVYLTLSASDKMREIFWGHVLYYSLGFMFLCFGIAILIALRKRLLKGTLTVWHLFFAMLYFACVALNGSQVLVLVTLPLLAAVVMERWLDVKTPWKSQETAAVVYLSTGLIIATIMGLIWMLLITRGVTSSYANAYSQWTAMNSWMDHLLALPIAWFELFGVDINGKSAIFAAASMPYLIRLAGALVAAVYPVVILLRYPKLKQQEVRVYVLSHFVLSAVIVFGYVCGMLYTANWRLSPILVSSLFLVMIYWGCERKEAFSMSYRITGIAGLMLLLLAGLNSITILKMDWNYNRDKKEYQVADFLEEHGLNYGYATFWNSQLITVYSGDKVKTREMLVTDEGHRTDYYQSEYTWYNDQPGQETYFLLLSEREYNQWKNTVMGRELLPKAIQVYEKVFGYYILVFDYNVI